MFFEIFVNVKVADAVVKNCTYFKKCYIIEVK